MLNFWKVTSSSVLSLLIVAGWTSEEEKQTNYLWRGKKGQVLSFKKGHKHGSLKIMVALWWWWDKDKQHRKNSRQIIYEEGKKPYVVFMKGHNHDAFFIVRAYILSLCMRYRHWGMKEYERSRERDSLLLKPGIHFCIFSIGMMRTACAQRSKD